MRTKVTVLFNARGRDWEVLRDMFIRAGLPEYAETGPDPTDLYAATVFEDDAALQKLTVALSAEGLTWTETREHSYTQTELEAAVLLRLTVTSRPRGLGGPTYGTRYDLSTACPVCGSGGRQIGPLVLNPHDLPRRAEVFQTLDGEILMSAAVTKLLESLALDLSQARAWKTGQKLPWFQLKGSATLPPMHSSTRGLVREHACPHCGRDGYFADGNGPLEIAYARDDVNLDSLPDAVRTQELFGNSVLKIPFEESHFAQGLVIVSAPVFRALNEGGVRGLRFDPVALV